MRPNLSGLDEIFCFATKPYLVQFPHLNDAAWY